jgi:hypothetical protein
MKFWIVGALFAHTIATATADAFRGNGERREQGTEFTTDFPTGDRCASALALPLGIPWSGNLLLNWYEIDGTGRRIHARACSSSEFYADTHIAVYRSSDCTCECEVVCAEEEYCVTVCDWNCPEIVSSADACNNPVYWDSEEGEVYSLSLSLTTYILTGANDNEEEPPGMSFIASENIEDLQQISDNVVSLSPTDPPITNTSPTPEDPAFDPPVTSILENMIQLMTDMVMVIPQMLDLMQTTINGASRMFTRGG